MSRGISPLLCLVSISSPVRTCLRWEFSLSVPELFQIFRRYLSLSEGVLLPDIGAQRSPRSARKLGGRGARLVIYSENRLMCVSGLSGLALLVVQGSDRPDSFLMDDKWYLLQNTIYKSVEAGYVTYARRSIYQWFIWLYCQSYPLRNFWQGRCRFRMPNTILKTLPLCVALAIIDIRYKKCLLGLLPCRKSGVQSTEKGFLVPLRHAILLILYCSASQCLVVACRNYMPLLQALYIERSGGRAIS